MAITRGQSRSPEMNNRHEIENFSSFLEVRPRQIEISQWSLRTVRVRVRVKG